MKKRILCKPQREKEKLPTGKSLWENNLKSNSSSSSALAAGEENKEEEELDEWELVLVSESRRSPHIDATR